MQKSNIHIRNNRRMLISNNFTALERAKANVLNNHKDGYWAAATYQILFINQIVYGIKCKAVSANDELTPNRSGNIKDFKQGELEVLTKIFTVFGGEEQD